MTYAECRSGMTYTECRTVLDPASGDPGEQLEELARRLAPGEYEAGKQLRHLAGELARCGLQVTVVDYQGSSQELEVKLPDAAGGALVTAGRDGTGSGCLLSWDQQFSIASPGDAALAAGIVAAVLHAVPGSRPGQHQSQDGTPVQAQPAGAEPARTAGDECRERGNR
jgi:hypothetical protein